MTTIRPPRPVVLIINESVNELLDLVNLLESCNCQVIPAISISIGLESMRLVKTQIVLIILGLQPGQEGSTALRRLQNQLGYAVPIIVLGTIQRSQQIQQVMQANCALYLNQDFSLEELRAIVIHCLAHPEHLL